MEKLEGLKGEKKQLTCFFNLQRRLKEQGSRVQPTLTGDCLGARLCRLRQRLHIWQGCGVSTLGAQRPAWVGGGDEEGKGTKDRLWAECEECPAQPYLLWGESRVG